MNTENTYEDQLNEECAHWEFIASAKEILKTIQVNDDHLRQNKEFYMYPEDNKIKGKIKK